MQPSFGFKPLKLNDIVHYDKTIVYFVGNYVYCWQINKVKMLDMEIKVIKVMEAKDFIVVVCLNKRKWLILVSKSEFKIVKRLEYSGECFVGPHYCIYGGDKTWLVNYNETSAIELDCRVVSVEFYKELGLVFDGKETLLIKNDKIDMKWSGLYRFMTRDLLTRHINGKIDIWDRKMDKIVHSSLEYNIHNGFLIDFDKNENHLSVIYPIEKKLALVIQVVAIEYTSEYIYITDGFVFSVLQLLMINGDVVLNQHYQVDFPFIKYLGDINKVISNNCGILLHLEQALIYIDFNSYSFLYAKEFAVEVYTLHSNLPLLYTHSLSTLKTFVLSYNKLFQLSSFFIKDSSKLLATQNALLSYTDKSMQFYSQYDGSLLCKYPFKVNLKSKFKICKSFMIVYADKSISVYKLYSFKKMEDFMSPLVIVDAYFDMYGLYILTATSLLQINEHDVIMDFHTNASYNQFIMHQVDDIKGICMFVNLHNYLVIQYSIVGKRMIIDHSKTISIDLIHILPLDWIINEFAVLLCLEGFLVFSNSTNNFTSTVSSYSAIEYGKDLISNQAIGLSDMNLQFEYDSKLLNEEYLSILDGLKFNYQVEVKKIVNMLHKERKEKQSAINELATELKESAACHLSAIKALRSTMEQKVLKELLISDALKLSCDKELSNVAKSNTLEMTKYHDKHYNALANNTTDHIKLKSSLLHTIQSNEHEIEIGRAHV